MPPRKRPPGNEEQGKALRKAREAARVTQQQLAEMLGYKKRDIIIDIEHGKIGLFADEITKVNEYLQVFQVRQETDLPILQDGPRLSFPELQARYSAETDWVDAEHCVPYVAVFPLMDEPPKLLTIKQVRGGRIHPQQYHISPMKLPGRLCKRIIASYKQLRPNIIIFAETRVRLVKAVYDRTKSTLKLGYAPATSDDDLITHRLLDYQLLSTEGKFLDEPTTLRNILEPKFGNGHLPPFGLISPLVNTIGLGGLVITQDHHLVLVSRSVREADSHLYDLSVQGAASTDEMTAHAYDVFTDFKQTAKEELRIELSAWVRLPGNTEALWLMGLLRNAVQGGKPAFIFLGKTTDMAATVQENAAKSDHSWENRYTIALPPETTIDALYTRLKPTSNHSATCRAAISLLIRWANAQGLSTGDTVADISKRLNS